MTEDTLSQLLALPIEERLRLSHLLWESTADAALDAPLSEEERLLLDARLEASDATPLKASPWPEARERIKEALEDYRRQ